MEDGYTKIIDGLLAGTQEPNSNMQMRESLRNDTKEEGLLDLGRGVPRPNPRRLTSVEILREAAKEQEVSSTDRIELVGVPRPSKFEPIRLREATYGAPGHPQVSYEDADTYRDVCDLYSVLDQERGNGTPNLENTQAESLGQTMQEGRPLSAMQIGLLRDLMAKHKTAIEALRASPDYDGQDYTKTPDPGTARLAESAGWLRPSRDNTLLDLTGTTQPAGDVSGEEGLLDLGDSVPKPWSSPGPHSSEPGSTVSKLRSSPATAGLLGDNVPKPGSRRMREVQGVRAPRDPENLTMREVRELCQEYEKTGVAA